MKIKPDDVRGVIIGGEDNRINARMVNTATGETVDSCRYLEDQQAAKAWALAVIEDRKKLWGSGFDRRYPAGFDLVTTW